MNINIESIAKTAHEANKAYWEAKGTWHNGRQWLNQLTKTRINKL